MEPPPTASLSPDLASAVEMTGALGSAAETGPSEADTPAWRDELSARLSRYRARRKAPPPRYPSLKLPFEAVVSSARTTPGNETSPFPAFESFSSHALALDGMPQEPSAIVEERPEPPARRELPTVRQSTEQPTALSTAKIIEFPRFAWGPPPPPPDQLAEPVSDRPRILEVPDVAPPPPALGGIMIEPTQREEAEKRPGIDIPLQSAPLGSRLIAAVIDGLIVAAASAFFGFIFWKVAVVHPPLVQIFGLAAAIPCVFWAMYQYLLIVYAASTPGLRVAGLQLTRFNGSSTSRAVRRWRVLASYLSAVSVGMGYAWVFLDEDALCWHDRITHTYLAPNKGVAGRQ